MTVDSISPAGGGKIDFGGVKIGMGVEILPVCHCTNISGMGLHPQKIKVQRVDIDENFQYSTTD